MFDLTPEERKVALFLITVALLGIGVNCLMKANPPVKALVIFVQDIGKIDLNHADKELLMSMRGIGEKLAQRIIEYRQEHGGIGDIQELRNIKGITNSTYEKIRDLLVAR